MKTREAIGIPLISVAAIGAAVLLHSQQATAPSPAAIEHTDVVTTYFWVGEPGDADNKNISNTASAWDDNWQQHYGGVDSPAHRSGYLPSGFKPRENPFYVALPYSDIAANGTHKPSDAVCAELQPGYDPRYSACKNIWVAITHGDKTVYAQWEDAGPFGENDTAYVFGNAAPKNPVDTHAGLDVSPAVHDYLGLQDVDHTSWHFVHGADVPEGPWKDIVTTSKGSSLD